ncbi:hypothetical protein H310_07704 [Aphanomyces invadans]|uniref:Uncharacterized protein n=1 Tax=Aphanomyces invadans TaxID=157072 RepID=A0A024U377_9STRA|nr:hypothetical protein H310_07704 [Aphanomyces invadans]ETW00337.1 hypothetical protein H310_07704 [Aphanomyces invadans]|eukprot:XP_008871362.1 hypothetical protein H310_07704 [Aphanomyces invadans]
MRLQCVVIEREFKSSLELFVRECHQVVLGRHNALFDRDFDQHVHGLPRTVQVLPIVHVALFQIPERTDPGGRVAAKPQLPHHAAVGRRQPVPFRRQVQRSVTPRKREFVLVGSAAFLQRIVDGHVRAGRPLFCVERLGQQRRMLRHDFKALVVHGAEVSHVGECVLRRCDSF